MYRMHIDIPMTEDKETSIALAGAVAEFLAEMKVPGVSLVQYRLSHDQDQGNKNLLDINENGHASTRKTRIDL